MHPTVSFQGRDYHFSEQFDVNLTLDYETQRWGPWHIIRELISNALDAVAGDPAGIQVSETRDTITISDRGQGYPVSYAKRIGASSKKELAGSIGQFGEGTKMAILAVLRLGIPLQIASQNWLIRPLAREEQGLSVLFYDIYETDYAIAGSVVEAGKTEAIAVVIQDLPQRFLHFRPDPPLFGERNNGIYPKGSGSVYNKGVWIKAIQSLFDYGITATEINRDRDIVDNQQLTQLIGSLWAKANVQELIAVYWANGVAAKADAGLIEYDCPVHPLFSNFALWREEFRKAFGDKAVIFTDQVAAYEAALLGYPVVALQYRAEQVARFVGIKTDVECCRKDYAFTWSDNLNREERERWDLLQRLTTICGRDLPPVRFFDAYAKSDNLLGMYEAESNGIFLKREILSRSVSDGLGVVLHELNHKHTEASDYDRRFAEGLTELASTLVLEVAQGIGKPVPCKLTPRGFQLPDQITLSPLSMQAGIATVGHRIIIELNEQILQAAVDCLLPPYASIRAITYHNGHFHLNLPERIRQRLPAELVFMVPIQ